MRIEQLVLYGPGDDERIRFGPGVTVFAGLTADDRTELLETVADALTGRLPNASVVYTDRDGHRVYADRTGATFAETGLAAPRPSEVLGRDPAALVELLRLDAAALGLGEQVSPEDLRRELTTSREALAAAQSAHTEQVERADMIQGWEAKLVELDSRIERAGDDDARWSWIGSRRRLDELQAELNIVEQSHHGLSDDQILATVDALRSAGAVWTELATEASSQREQIGDLPDVSPEDLDRVAATPPALPPGFAAQLESWQAAHDLCRSAEAEVQLIKQPVPVPEDPLVVHFASIDQSGLWAVHAELARATETYERHAVSADRGDLTTEAEERIEAAHLEVVRCQRTIERRFRPGVLASAALTVTALLAGQAISVALGVIMLIAAVAMGLWLLAVPRRQLGVASAVEREALSHADASSWLGLHLRRLDTLSDANDQKEYEVAADARAAARLDWDELAGAHQPDELDERAEAVRAHAVATDPQLMARRRKEADAFAIACREAEAAARQSLATGLSPYGLGGEFGADLAPPQLLAVLEGRITAGAAARRTRTAVQLDQREADAAHRLDGVLTHLGYQDGSLESRLERAIGAVASARARQENGVRTKAELKAEIATMQAELRATARPGWAEAPEPTGPPTDPELLKARRQEVGELINAAGAPDVVGAERRVQATEAKVADLVGRLDELGRDHGSLRRRLMERCARGATIGGSDDAAPVVVDEALLSVPVGERLDLLDVLIDVSANVQVIMLTEDPVVSRWARDRATNAPVALYQSTAEPAPARPVTTQRTGGPTPILWSPAR